MRAMCSSAAQAGDTCFAAGVLDFRAWLLLVNSAQLQNAAAGAAHVLAAVALLLPVAKVEAMDISNADIAEFPEILHVFPAVRMVDLSRNRRLQSIVQVQRCEGLLAIDLSDCALLSEVRVLGALTQLQSVDFSRCTAIKNVAQFLRADDHSKFKDVEGTTAAATSKGHNSLQWLSLSGCTGLKHGIAELRHCPAIRHADLFGCLMVDPVDCHAASQAPSLEVFVWPEVEVLESLARSQAWPLTQHKAALAAASVSATAKLALAHEGRRGVGLRRSDAGAPYNEAELAAATCAVREFSSAGLGTELAGEGHAAIGEAPRRRASPLAFARFLKASTFCEHNRLPEHMDACDLFRIIDVDRDGGISLSDLQALSSGPISKEIGIESFARLADHHIGLWDAVAADLAGGRAAIDSERIAQCLMICGVEASVAPRAAASLRLCAAGKLLPGAAGDVEAALRHGLAPFAVARAANLAADFQRSVLERSAGGLAQLAAELRHAGRLGRRKLRRFAEVVLQWRHLSTPGAFEAVCRTMGLYDHGTISSDDCIAFLDVNFPEVIACMVASGRRLSNFPASRPEALRGDQDFMISQKDFENVWISLGEVGSYAHPTVVFGLLDINDCSFLSRTSIDIWADALPRHAEVAAVGALEAFLQEQYGSLQAAYTQLLETSASSAIATQPSYGYTRKSSLKPKQSVKRSVLRMSTEAHL